MKGILMTPENHDKIRQGLKTQTRRLGNLKEINHEPDRWVKVHPVPTAKLDFHRLLLIRLWVFHDNNDNNQVVKPQYRIGEMVYIKEAWATENGYNRLKPSLIPRTAKIWYLSDVQYDPFQIGIKRSPLFMPAWAARTFVKFTDVRPERLNQITEEDAVAEGIMLKAVIIQGREVIDEPNYINAFAMLWDSINGKTYPWDLNPWCWRICFNLTD